MVLILLVMVKERHRFLRGKPMSLSHSHAEFIGPPFSIVVISIVAVLIKLWDRNHGIQILMFL